MADSSKTRQAVFGRSFQGKSSQAQGAVEAALPDPVDHAYVQFDENGFEEIDENDFPNTQPLFGTDQMLRDRRQEQPTHSNDQSQPVMVDKIAKQFEEFPCTVESNRGAQQT